MILDLLSPSGASTNDGVDGQYCFLRYTSIDDAAKMIAKLGQRMLLTKIDIVPCLQECTYPPCGQVVIGYDLERQSECR